MQKDGITWQVSRVAALSLAKLEDSLSDMKALFKAKFGEDVDDEDDDEDDEVSRRVAPLRSRNSRIVSLT